MEDTPKRDRMSWDDYNAYRGVNRKVVSLGCGQTNPPDVFGIDVQDLVGVDLVCDLTKGIPLPTESCDVVVAEDFLEHIAQGQPCVNIMQEIYRVLKFGGHLRFEVPSTDGYSTGAFQDPYHISFWNQNKFEYFMEDDFGKGFRAIYNIQAWFTPSEMVTYNNQWRVTYVAGKLTKKPRIIKGED